MSEPEPELEKNEVPEDKKEAGEAGEDVDVYFKKLETVFEDGQVPEEVRSKTFEALEELTAHIQTAIEQERAKHTEANKKLREQIEGMEKSRKLLQQQLEVQKQFVQMSNNDVGRRAQQKLEESGATAMSIEQVLLCIQKSPEAFYVAQNLLAAKEAVATRAADTQKEDYRIKALSAKRQLKGLFTSPTNESGGETDLGPEQKKRRITTEDNLVRYILISDFIVLKLTQTNS